MIHKTAIKAALKEVTTIQTRGDCN